MTIEKLNLEDLERESSNIIDYLDEKIKEIQKEKSSEFAHIIMMRIVRYIFSALIININEREKK